jgi:hypothetical protein
LVLELTDETISLNKKINQINSNNKVNIIDFSLSNSYFIIFTKKLNFENKKHEQKISDQENENIELVISQFYIRFLINFIKYDFKKSSDVVRLTDETIVLNKKINELNANNKVNCIF